MRDQTAREARFPAACARCGGRISEPVTFCPHCGAHARFALAGNAPHIGEAGHTSHAPRQQHGAAASARAAPKVPHYDFEGDLDPPWPGPPTPLFASPDGDPYGEVHAPGFRGERQFGIKAGTVLVVAAFVVLYGGALAVHRFDGSSPLSQPSTAKSADGAIAPKDGEGANSPAPSGDNVSQSGTVASSNASQPPAPAVNNAAPSNGSVSNSVSTSVAANTAMRNVAPPAANAGVSRQPDSTTVASLPPVSAPVQALPETAPPQTAPQAQTQIQPQAQPQVQPQTQPQAQPQVQPQTQPLTAQDAHAADRGRSHAQSAEAPNSLGDTTAANTQAGRQLHRSQSQREAGQFGRAAAARALDSAQAQLAKNDLRGARASLARALAADPNNSQALSLRDELVSREQQRDASLSAAHACVVQSRWNCVWHNAGNALSVDASSAEAKALVDRAIVESGAATAPAGPGPDNVQVPMLQ